MQPLTDAELLARLVNDAHLAARLLAHYGSLPALAQAAAGDLARFGDVSTVLVALEFARRALGYHPDARPEVHTAADAARLLHDMAGLTQEHVRVLLLDAQRRVIAIETVYIGTLNASVLRVAEVYREAIIRNCPALIVAHNHPAGDPTPSPEDITISRALAAAGRLLDIHLLDHLIIAARGWKSLGELGLL